MKITDKKDQERANEETPIIDGDARPDIDIHPEDTKKNKALVKNKDQNKTTQSRKDVNSLEDFRDAKQE